MQKLPDRIAFVGYARAGKDEAAKALYPLLYRRRNFGDLIKSELDDLVKKHFRFSAFTEVDEEKRRIRATLQAWGDDNYERILKLYFDRLPMRVMNTRLVRIAEAVRWKSEGGVIVEITRPKTPPATEWEFRAFRDLKDNVEFDAVINNDGTIADLHRKTIETLSNLWKTNKPHREESVSPGSSQSHS
jgi:hypothetical protein